MDRRHAFPQNAIRKLRLLFLCHVIWAPSSITLDLIQLSLKSLYHRVENRISHNLSTNSHGTARINKKLWPIDLHPKLCQILSSIQAVQKIEKIEFYWVFEFGRKCRYIAFLRTNYMMTVSPKCSLVSHQQMGEGSSLSFCSNHSASVTL